MDELAPPLRDALEQLNRAAAAFFRADVDIAYTLLELAEISSDAEECQCSVRHARETLHTLDHFLQQLNLDLKLAFELATERNRLRLRIEEFEAGRQSG